MLTELRQDLYKFVLSDVEGKYCNINKYLRVCINGDANSAGADTLDVWGSGAIAPRILNLGSDLHAQVALTPGKEPPVSVGCEAGCIPEPF